MKSRIIIAVSGALLLACSSLAAYSQNQPDLPLNNPGMLNEKFDVLHRKIEAARKEGIGVTPYANALKSIENDAAANGQLDAVSKRCDSLLSTLEAQFERSHQLKFQKPTPPVAASDESPVAVAPVAAQNKKKKKKKDKSLEESNQDALNLIQEKWFGGEIPKGVKNQIPKNMDPNYLNTDAAKDMLNRLKER